MCHDLSRLWRVKKIFLTKDNKKKKSQTSIYSLVWIRIYVHYSTCHWYVFTDITNISDLFFEFSQRCS